jgi:hypothetical protein
MQLTKCYKRKEKTYKKQLQKQRKAIGNGEYNLIKYICQMSSPHKIWSHNVSCSDFDISTKQYNFLKSPIGRARHTGKAHLIRRVSAECFVYGRRSMMRPTINEESDCLRHIFQTFFTRLAHFSNIPCSVNH